MWFGWVERTYFHGSKYVWLFRKSTFNNLIYLILLVKVFECFRTRSIRSIVHWVVTRIIKTKNLTKITLNIIFSGCFLLFHPRVFWYRITTINRSNWITWINFRTFRFDMSKELCHWRLRINKTTFRGIQYDESACCFSQFTPANFALVCPTGIFILGEHGFTDGLTGCCEVSDFIWAPISTGDSWVLQTSCILHWYLGQFCLNLIIFCLIIVSLNSV